MASFDGNEAMFGNWRAVESVTVLAPLRRQRVTFPGVDGVLDKPLGTQGGRVTFRGVLEGVTLPALIALQTQWTIYQHDGGAYALVDSVGVGWPAAVLIQFKPTTEVYFDGLLYCREYEGEFDLLV